jgi:D-glycero-alpha-D-manno-heptose-7-phosphate kinase
MDKSKWIDLSKLLIDYTVTGSAPCRLDCGGSTDHRLTALLCRHWLPATTNICLELRTTIYLEPHTSGKILVKSNDLGEQEACIPKLPLTGPLSLVYAVLAYFAVHGVCVIIDSQAPPYSGLGGSGAVSVATIGALIKALSLLKAEACNIHDIVLLAHNIEDSLYGNTGLQDQAAAAYGGIHLWEWKFTDVLDFTGRQLICNPLELEKHIILASTGITHPSSHQGSSFLNVFKRNGNLELLVQISEQARVFAEAIQAENYEQAGCALSAEFNLRSQVMPDLLPEDDQVLAEAAMEAGCGVKPTGHGQGGCIWAIGTKEAIAQTEKRWKDIFGQRGFGYLLPVSIARSGLSTVALPK